MPIFDTSDILTTGLTVSGSTTLSGSSTVFLPTTGNTFTISGSSGPILNVQNNPSSPTLFSVSTTGGTAVMTVTTSSMVVNTPSGVTITGSVLITGSLNVNPGSGLELQVDSSGVTIGSLITDTHRVTGSLSVTGSVTATSFVGDGSGLTGITGTGGGTSLGVVYVSSLKGLNFLQIY